MEKIIFENNTLKIIQDKHTKTLYTMEFNYPSASLLRSITRTRLIKSGTTTNDYQTFRFKALEIKTLQQYKGQHNPSKIPITFAAKMIASLGAQLNYLISSERKTIIGYAPENIIVIDGTPAFLDSELIADLEPAGSEYATISCPFSVKDFFCSPELLRIKELPSKVHYKTAYFSLGCLILDALLTSDYDFYNEYLREMGGDKIQEYLDQLHFKGTKLYWLLSRCIIKDPERRSILFI